MRIETGVVNEIMAEAVALQQPPSDKGKRLKLYYITQVSVKPPTFVIFVNDKQLMHFSYTRYIENKIREASDLKEHLSDLLYVKERKTSNDLAKDSMCFNRICFWTVSDRVYYRKDETH